MTRQTAKDRNKTTYGGFTMTANSTAKTYFITGGAGFIGSHLSEALIAQGHSVIALDDLSTGSVSNLENVIDNPNFSFVEASVLNKEEVNRLAADSDIIVHLAAAVGVKLVTDEVIYTIETNIMGTQIVLEAALANKCKVMIASTSEVYGKNTKFPFNEEDDVVLGPSSKSRWGYAASKMIDEFLGLAYHKEHGLDVVLFRLFNTVGPRQIGRYGMVIPRFVQQALQNDPLTVYSDGQQSRCFCDARDVVQAIIKLSEAPDAPGRVFNIGGLNEITILELAHKVKEMTNSSSPIIHVPLTEVYGEGFEETLRREPDLTRTQSTIDWEPTYTLEQTLQDIMEVFKKELVAVG